jgi:hypothetical protein
MKYTIEDFKEEFDNALNIKSKQDIILKAVSYQSEFDKDYEFSEVINEYKQQLTDIKKDFEKEEDLICSKSIEDGKYELFTCIKSTYVVDNEFIQEGNDYYVRLEDPKSILGEMWSEVATDEIKGIISDMSPIIWIIVDNGIGTTKSRITINGKFEEYFKS